MCESCRLGLLNSAVWFSLLLAPRRCRRRPPGWAMYSWLNPLHRCGRVQAGRSDCLALLAPAVCLGFGRWDVSDGLPQSVVVEPRDPLERGEFDRLACLPGRASMYQLGLVQPVDRLGRRVIVALGTAIERRAHLVPTDPMQNPRQDRRSHNRRHPSLNPINDAQSPTLPVIGIAHGGGRRVDRQMRHGDRNESPDVLGNVSLIDAIRQSGNLNQVLCLCLRRAGALSSVSLLRADGRGHGGGSGVHEWPWVKLRHGRHESPAGETAGQEKSTWAFDPSASHISVFWLLDLGSNQGPTDQHAVERLGREAALSLTFGLSLSNTCS